MTTATRLHRAALVAVSVALIAACGFGANVSLTVAAAVLGVLGWVGALRHWSWSTHVVFVGQVGLVAAAAWVGAPLGWLLPALLAALAAWDLDRFVRRVTPHQAPPIVEALEVIQRRHLIALGATLIGGGALSGLGLLARAPLGFGVTLALALALAILLGWAARRLAA